MTLWPSLHAVQHAVPPLALADLRRVERPLEQLAVHELLLPCRSRGRGRAASALACVVDPAADLSVEGIERDGVGVELVLQLQDLAPQPAVLCQERGHGVLELDDARRQTGPRPAPAISRACRA